MDEILNCDSSNISYQAMLSVVEFGMLHEVILTFESVDEILKHDHPNRSY